MRADLETVKSDLAYLRSRGFSGVRIFPQWRRPQQDPGDTLLDAAGAIRSQRRWSHFAGMLLEAGSCGLLVDVTFNRESLPGFSVDAGEFAEMVAAKKVAKFSVTSRQVTLYLGDVKPGDVLTFEYSLRARYPLRVQAPGATAWEYYTPANRAESRPVEITVEEKK